MMESRLHVLLAIIACSCLSGEMSSASGVLWQEGKSDSCIMLGKHLEMMRFRKKGLQGFASAERHVNLAHTYFPSKAWV